ncbi:MAG: hypothetical protein CL844_01010 [Crocinitomicaceae bacterium]|nr:hypothetical protein [Crocinitomicaceae bacterium]|tara:strand:+ start:43585 stop:44493 length:909 start_codon:yes stop_codon:yes gene_type:complete
MTKILCINYSQSGQLNDIVDNFISPLKEVYIDRIKIDVKENFPFPWKVNNFYDAMPETVLEEPITLKELKFKEKKYDLIILGYQPWFLSPSIPTTSLLKNDDFKKIMKNTNIITIIGARNMWLNAHKSVTNHISQAGGKLIGNIALIDKSLNHLSAISIAHWMLTGHKTKKWGIFPKPGISEKDIKEVDKFGIILNQYLRKKNYIDLQKQFIKNKAVKINSNILFIEKKAKKIFIIWAKLIKKKELQGKNRSTYLKVFRIYLNIALFILSPILILFDIIFIRPFTQKSIKQEKKDFSYLNIK